MDKKQKGFTLIEMILVTVIIGILAGVVITVINVPRTQARARDSRRIGDLKRIQTALDLYFFDNRKYPVVPNNFDHTRYALSVITPSYIDQIPTDPLDGKDTSNTVTMRCMNQRYVHGYYYISDAGGSRYVMAATMELPLNMQDSNQCSNIPNCDFDISGIHCGGSSTNAYCYCVQNP